MTLPVGCYSALAACHRILSRSLSECGAIMGSSMIRRLWWISEMLRSMQMVLLVDLRKRFRMVEQRFSCWASAHSDYYFFKQIRKESEQRFAGTSLIKCVGRGSNFKRDAIRYGELVEICELGV